jgi:hypothetical protein
MEAVSVTRQALLGPFPDEPGRNARARPAERGFKAEGSANATGLRLGAKSPNRA